MHRSSVILVLSNLDWCGCFEIHRCSREGPLYAGDTFAVAAPRLCWGHVERCGRALKKRKST